MAWTTPATWIDGNLVSAADLNPQVRDNLRYLKGLDGVPRIESALELPEAATPASPSSGYGRLYFKSDGGLYALNDAGTEVLASQLTGTYTPTYTGSTTAGTTTYSAQEGEYTRIGRIVVASGRVWWTAASGTGNARVLLPFPIANAYRASGSVMLDSVTFSGGSPEAILTPGGSFFEMVSPASNVASIAIAVEAAGLIIWTVIYSTT